MTYDTHIALAERLKQFNTLIPQRAYQLLISGKVLVVFSSPQSDEWQVLEPTTTTKALAGEIELRQNRRKNNS